VPFGRCGIALQQRSVVGAARQRSGTIQEKVANEAVHLIREFVDDPLRAVAKTVDAEIPDIFHEPVQRRELIKLTHATLTYADQAAALLSQALDPVTVAQWQAEFRHYRPLIEPHCQANRDPSLFDAQNPKARPSVSVCKPRGSRDDAPG
jgi:hypothetical protein